MAGGGRRMTFGEIERAAPDRGAALVITRALFARSVPEFRRDDDVSRDCRDGGHDGLHRVRGECELHRYNLGVEGEGTSILERTNELRKTLCHSVSSTNRNVP